MVDQIGPATRLESFDFDPGKTSANQLKQHLSFIVDYLIPDLSGPENYLKHVPTVL